MKFRANWTWDRLHQDSYRADSAALDLDFNAAPRGGDIANGEGQTGSYLGSPDSDIFIFSNSDIKAVGGAGDDIFDMTGSRVAIRAGTGADIVTLNSTTGTVDLGKDDDGDLLLADNPVGLITVKNFDVGEDLLSVDWSHITIRDTGKGTYLDYDGSAFLFLSGVHDFEI